jgi:tetratricopeptide (TPR) repeat protein
MSAWPPEGRAMTAVTTWTGWEANALRKALRMSLTDFAEHLGAARRTVAKWSSQGRDIQPRTQLQAALDTVLARASADVRERFEHLLSAGAEDNSQARMVWGIASVVDTHEGQRADLDQGDDMQRREFLTDTAIGGAAVIPAVARLLDALLMTDPAAVEPDAPPFLPHLAGQVAVVKGDYQACRYERVHDRLVSLLPAFAAARSHLVGDERTRLDVLATDLYHVVGSVLLKCGDRAMAMVEAERSARCGLDSGDPVAAGVSARILTHALLGNGHSRRAVALAQQAAADLGQATRLGSTDAIAVYGALVLRGAIAAAGAGDRDAAATMLDEAAAAATRLGHDGNDRWTGFGPNNVLQHRVNVALVLGDAGTAITFARQVRVDRITLAERKASLFVDVAQAYTQWGRHEQALSALRAAYRIAPEEIRSRPAVHRIVDDLAVLSRGHTRSRVVDFSAGAGIRR